MTLHRWTWKDVRRQFTTPAGRWLPVTAGGITLFNRRRSRSPGTASAAPRSPDPGRADQPDGSNRGEPVALKGARRVRRAVRGLPRVPANPRVRDGELRGIHAVWADPAPGFVRTPGRRGRAAPGTGARRGPSCPRRPMICSRAGRSRAPCGCRSAIAARPLTCPSARRTGSYRGQGGKRGRRCRLRARDWMGSPGLQDSQFSR